MSLTHFFYEPFYSLSDFDRLFDETFDARQPNSRPRGQNGQLTTRQGSTLSSLRPKKDVHEDKEKNLVTATFELPGLKKEDVQIDVHNNVLTVSGETKVDETKERDGYAGIKEEEIKAALEDGILSVTFPRSAPEGAPRKIAVA